MESIRHVAQACILSSPVGIDTILFGAAGNDKEPGGSCCSGSHNSRQQQRSSHSLARELACSVEVAQVVYDQVISSSSAALDLINNGIMTTTKDQQQNSRHAGTSTMMISAADLVHQHQRRSERLASSIITFRDNWINCWVVAIPLGEITEVAGSPGSGKTQLAMQLAVNASLPEPVDAVNGSVLYIDTEGSFSAERCHEMAESLLQHIQRGIKKQQQKRATLQQRKLADSDNGNDTVTTSIMERDVMEQFLNVTVRDILEGIHVIRVHNPASLFQALCETEEEPKGSRSGRRRMKSRSDWWWSIALHFHFVRPHPIPTL